MSFNKKERKVDFFFLLLNYELSNYLKYDTCFYKGNEKKNI